MNKSAIIALITAVSTSVWTWWPDSDEYQAVDPQITQVLTASGESVDATKVAGVRVITIDDNSQEPKPFEVRLEQGKWTIPSHFNYPADGGTMVGSTAGAVLNLPMGPLVTADRETHAEYGLLDPLKTGNTANAGKRVTLSDEGGATLVDVIIGKQKTGTDVYFVRRAQEDSVYTAKVKPDAIKATFQDWVETDLLKLNEADLREVTVRDYSVDEQTGTLKDRSTTSLKRNDDKANWVVTPKVSGKALSETTASDLTGEASRLRLVGVRPYADAWLQERGFYIGRDPSGSQQLFGNEGEVQLVSADGLVYHLFFGEIALGDAIDKQAKRAETTAKVEGAHNRYMAVFVQYNAELDQTIPAQEYPPVAVPEQPKTTDASTDKSSVSSTPAVAKAQGSPTNQEAIDKALKDGLSRAQKSQEHFQRFFYVISDESFNKLRPSQESLYEVPKPAEASPKMQVNPTFNPANLGFNPAGR
jgi:hypothetical protein